METEQDREQIRAARQAKAEAKAARLEGWAAKRRAKADATFAAENRDWAFMSQPGRIPGRAREIAKHDRALESIGAAKEMEDRAERLRSGVRVAGDAEIAKEARREAVRQWVRVGMDVIAGAFGVRTVAKVNRKTIAFAGGTGTYTVDLAHVSRAAAEGGAP